MSANPAEAPKSKIEKFIPYAEFVAVAAFAAFTLGSIYAYGIAPIIRAYQHVDFTPGDLILASDPEGLSVFEHDGEVIVTLPPDQYATPNWLTVIPESESIKLGAAQHTTANLDGSGLGGNPKGLQAKFKRSEDGDLCIGGWGCPYQITDAELLTALDSSELSPRITSDQVIDFAAKTGKVVAATVSAGGIYLAYRKLSSAKAEKLARKNAEKLSRKSQANPTPKPSSEKDSNIVKQIKALQRGEVPPVIYAHRSPTPEQIAQFANELSTKNASDGGALDSHLDSLTAIAWHDTTRGVSYGKIELTEEVANLMDDVADVKSGKKLIKY